MRGYLRQIANSVNRFMRLGGQATPKAPCIPLPGDLKAREAFLVEEVKEMQLAIFKIETAYKNRDASEVEKDTELLQEYADSLLDVIYVAVGSLLNAGINPEVQEALMQKVCHANDMKFHRVGLVDGRYTIEELEEMYPEYNVEKTADILGNPYAALRDPKTLKIKKPNGWTDPKVYMQEILEKAIAFGEQNESYAAGDLFRKRN